MFLANCGPEAQGGRGGGGEGKPCPLQRVNTRRGSANLGQKIDPQGPFGQINSESIYAYAHAADPVYSLRRNPLRHLAFETPFSRFYKVPIPWTQRHPRDPTPTPTPQGTQGDPRGPKGTHGDPRGGKGPWDPLGLFRSHSEWNAISSGGLLRKEAHSEMKTVAKDSCPRTNCSKL